MIGELLCKDVIFKTLKTQIIKTPGEKQFQARKDYTTRNCGQIYHFTSAQRKLDGQNTVTKQDCVLYDIRKGSKNFI